MNLASAIVLILVAAGAATALVSVLRRRKSPNACGNGCKGCTLRSACEAEGAHCTQKKS